MGSGAKPRENNGAGDGTRTRDLLITNQLLYQLSYAGQAEETPVCETGSTDSNTTVRRHPTRTLACAEL